MGSVYFLFLSSVMEMMVKHWKACGLYKDIHKKKEIFLEPKNSEVFRQTFDNFYKKMLQLGKPLRIV